MHAWIVTQETPLEEWPGPRLRVATVDGVSKATGAPEFWFVRELWLLLPLPARTSPRCLSLPFGHLFDLYGSVWEQK